MIRDPRSACPINRALETVGDRWSLVILRDVLAHNRHGFREILTHNEEKISAPMLSRRLADLVEAGILRKTEAPRGAAGSYEITDLGLHVIPILEALTDFGMALDPRTAAHPLAHRAPTQQGTPS